MHLSGKLHTNTFSLSSGNTVGPVKQRRVYSLRCQLESWGARLLFSLLLALLSAEVCSLDVRNPCFPKIRLAPVAAQLSEVSFKHEHACCSEEEHSSCLKHLCSHCQSHLKSQC